MLLVSIHDVTPALETNVRRLWDICAEAGLCPALLVVPNWHGEWPLEQYPEFVGWIRSRLAEGAELMLHGERHDEIGLPRRFKDQLRAWGSTQGEGEFLTLDEPAARARITHGLDRLRALGLHPAGFVAPAWLARDATDRAAAAAGLKFTEDSTSIRLLASGERLPSPALRWSARTTLRAWGSAAVASARWYLQRDSTWLRLALHPQDLEHRVTARSLARALERWREHQQAGRYANLTAALESA
jgi:predicted deacetylase